MRGGHPYNWGREHPLIVDGLIAVACGLLGFASLAAEPPNPEFKDPDVLSAVLTIAGSLPLVLRRRYPLAVYVVIAPPGLSYFILSYDGAGPWFGMLVGLYGVAAYANRRPAIVCLVFTVATVGVGLIDAADGTDLGDILASIGLFGTAWVLGDNMRVRRAYVAAVEDRAAHLESERDAQAERAVLQERGRIARELHDVVAHSMSVMVVQAGAARRTLARDPNRAVEAIGHIETTGRGALAEMRRLVGMLRGGRNDGNDGDESRDGASRLPQPGIDQVPVLVQQCREAGLEVALQVDGAARPLPSGVELVVYRIVQEALTNTMQHAGPAKANVELHYGAEVVSLAVSDDGRGAASDHPGGASSGGDSGGDRDDGTPPGHGLTGMRERVSLYGGEITAGPRAGGGFRVWAEIPVAAETGS